MTPLNKHERDNLRSLMSDQRIRLLAYWIDPKVQRRVGRVIAGFTLNPSLAEPSEAFGLSRQTRPLPSAVGH